MPRGAAPALVSACYSRRRSIRDSHALRRRRIARGRGGRVRHHRRTQRGRQDHAARGHLGLGARRGRAPRVPRAGHDAAPVAPAGRPRHRARAGGAARLCHALGLGESGAGLLPDGGARGARPRAGGRARPLPGAPRATAADGGVALGRRAADAGAGAASWRRPTGCCSTSPRRGSPPIFKTIDRIRRSGARRFCWSSRGWSRPSSWTGGAGRLARGAAGRSAGAARIPGV